MLTVRLYEMAFRNCARRKEYVFLHMTIVMFLYLKEGQYSPNHFHWFKTEDIINRGGGNVLIRVYNSHPDESTGYESVPKSRM